MHNIPQMIRNPDTIIHHALLFFFHAGVSFPFLLYAIEIILQN